MRELMFLEEKLEQEDNKVMGGVSSDDTYSNESTIFLFSFYDFFFTYPLYGWIRKRR